MVVVGCEELGVAITGGEEACVSVSASLCRKVWVQNPLSCLFGLHVHEIVRIIASLHSICPAFRIYLQFFSGVEVTDNF